ncbi:hypothetical protein PCANC_23518 [Puccinia coronata f. sp. avenae]|uniref:Uncharacterized protein n=1 Tax=Puccinia coronata f. sp. avenae TaxID=200324 RepID=A0A2N5S2R0_9BASI|nr:hypothetical protein PCANC_23518 [Puccinia coronata f. sp. avenae]
MHQSAMVYISDAHLVCAARLGLPIAKEDGLDGLTSWLLVVVKLNGVAPAIVWIERSPPNTVTATLPSPNANAALRQAPSCSQNDGYKGLLLSSIKISSSHSSQASTSKQL